MPLIFAEDFTSTFHNSEFLKQLFKRFFPGILSPKSSPERQVIIAQ